MDLAGRDVTEYLRVLLRREGYEFHRSNEFEIVREMKENACYLALDPTKVENNSVKSSYALPDTTKIEISNSLFRAPEVLFKPDLIGTEWPGMAHVVNQSIMKCDVDLRQTLYSNIVLSGGTTLFKGFGDRLLGEMRKIAPADGKIRISASQERNSLTWIGGSIVASLDTFRKMWLGKKEYEDMGASAMHKRFF
ncbi:Actin [Caenorhabditis elegans]|nr:Actin [Caenorhabditis elegans]CDH93057.1 Actin [Caenorhabditis elegans]|eukprot:NP_001293551.1 Actin-Related Proteins [Caenorhabditis elegans]